MIDYSKIKPGDKLTITGMGAPGFAKLDDTVTVESTNGENRCDVIHDVSGEKAFFALTCGAQRLETTDGEPEYFDTTNYWKLISEAPTDGKELWLGWKPFVNKDGEVTSGVVPRRGAWDVGSRQWIAWWEDRGSPDGQTPMPFTPQPDYYCEGFTPSAPTQ
jgi:hypothetical protein